MPTAYYELLGLIDDHNTITITLSAIDNSCRVYRNGDKIKNVEFNANDVDRIKKYCWGDLNPMTPNISIERFIRVLAPDTIS